MWDLIVSVPDHCLSFYFTATIIRRFQRGLDCEIFSCLFDVDTKILASLFGMTGLAEDLIFYLHQTAINCHFSCITFLISLRLMSFNRDMNQRI